MAYISSRSATVSTNCSDWPSSTFFSPRNSVEFRPFRKDAARVDRMLAVAVAPAADGVEVLHREADRVHPRMAAGACRCRAVLNHRVAQRERLAGSRFVLSAGTSAGGGGGAAESRFSSTHLPRSTGDVRVE
jgi:hypothetical protein